MSDNRPIFQAVRKQHNITLNMLIEDTQLPPDEVRRVDTTGLGTPEMIDAMLASLSRMTGRTYTRENVGGFVFSLHSGETAQDDDEV